jgi:hypothetical protein
LSVEEHYLTETAGVIVALGVSTQTFTPAETVLALSALPVGSRLIIRCRADWRVATVTGNSQARVTLSVGSPSGRTYRVRRSPETPLTLEGPIPVLGDAGPAANWRANFARYDARW